MAFTNELEETKEYGNLKVLTVLTFIGCAVFLIFTLITPALMNFSKKMMDKATSSGQELTAKQLDDIEKGRNSIALVEANMVTIMVTGIIGIIACFVGALLMRKLKKEGFYLYVVGEILPLIVGFILMGMAQFTGVTSYVTNIGIPILFIILYAANFKYLK